MRADNTRVVESACVAKRRWSVQTATSRIASTRDAALGTRAPTRMIDNEYEYADRENKAYAYQIARVFDR